MAQKIVGVGEVRCSNCGQVFKKASHCPACHAPVKASKIVASSYQASVNQEQSQRQNYSNEESYNQQDSYRQSGQDSYTNGFRGGFNRFGNGFSYSFGGFSTELSPKKRSITLLLALFLGVVGVHRFYTGHYFTALVMMFCSTVLGWWAFIIIWLVMDIISIFLGLFRDGMGRLVALWR